MNMTYNDCRLLDTRRKLYDAITRFPGIHFRELRRKISTGNGNLNHHLRILEERQLIDVEHFRYAKRFYPKGLSAKQRVLLSFLRQRNFRKIIATLVDTKRIAHHDAMAILDLSPSSTSWYLKELIAHSIIKVVKCGRGVQYYLTDKREVMSLLREYRASFFDQLVDNFVDAWET